MSFSFTIFGKELVIPVYGICFLVGIILSSVCAALIKKRRKIERFDLAGSAVFALIGGLVGAKLLFVAVSLKEIIELQVSFENIIKGGFVFYGGLLGGMLGIFIYVKIYKLNMADFFDVYAVALPLGHAAGRVGCFFGGCCYGIPYDGPLSHTYTQSLDIHTPIGVPLLPTQLIESAALLVLFGVLLTVFLKTEKKGAAAWTYIFAYPVIRFIIEFFRGDAERGKLLGLSTSQWVSILIVLCAAIYLAVKKSKTKRKHSEKG